MFRTQRGPKPPQFSDADIKAIVDRALPRVAEELGEPVYLTSDQLALVTELDLRTSIRTALETENENLTGESLAARLQVQRSLVQQILPRAAEGLHGVYIDSVLILPRPRVEQLVRRLTAGQDSIWRTQTVCADEGLTIKALDYVVRHSNGALALAGQGDYIVSAATLDSHVQRVTRELDSATGPVKFSAVEPDPVLRELVQSALGLSGETFTPQSYLDAQLQSAVSTLSEVGYISHADLASLEIRDAARFAKRQNAILLKDYVVDGQFFEKQKADVLAALAERRYFDLRDFPLGRRLSEALIADDKAKLSKYVRRDAYPNHLVKPSLERDLTAKITKALQPEAQAAAAAIEIKVSGSISAEALLNQLKLPSSTDVAKRFLTDLPEDLPVADRITPQIRGSYSAVALAVLKQRVEEAMERLDAKVLAYLNALQTVENGELRAQLWEEWQQYVSENDFSVPGSEQEASHQFQARPELVVEAATELVALTETRLKRLSKPKDAAHVLHYAVIVYHAKHYVPARNGVLKFRGKAVPKMLKHFDFPASFGELRSAIKAPTPELLARVKDDAVVN